MCAYGTHSTLGTAEDAKEVTGGTGIAALRCTGSSDGPAGFVL